MSDKKILALYCGSFNPFHVGHLNILQKAKHIFQDVLICKGINPDKPTAEEMNEDRRMFVINGVKGIFYACFVHELVEQYERLGFNVILIRGLRNGDDLDYESNQLAFIKSFKPDIKVVYIPCDKEFEHISSSSIRSLNKFRAGTGDKYIV